MVVFALIRHAVAALMETADRDISMIKLTAELLIGEIHMKNRINKSLTIFAFMLFWPMIALSGSVGTNHQEFSISQEFPAPACLGLPEGATIAEDFLHVVDTQVVSTGQALWTRLIRIESNGTASANDGAWMWDIRMHASRVGVLSFKGSATKETLMQVRHFISKQPGVPNLMRTVKSIVVLNAKGELVVAENPSMEEFDFVCIP